MSSFQLQEILKKIQQIKEESHDEAWAAFTGIKDLLEYLIEVNNSKQGKNGKKKN